jgi:hypothetical protein
MLEVLFIPIIAALFFLQVIFFRRLMARQVDQTLQTLVTDYEPTPTREKVVAVPSQVQPVAVQQPINQLKE